MKIALDLQSSGSGDLLEFGKAEVTQFFFVSLYESEEDVGAVELKNEPCPVCPWCEELHQSVWVRIVLVVIEGWECPHDLLWEQSVLDVL